MIKTGRQQGGSDGSPDWLAEFKRCAVGAVGAVGALEQENWVAEARRLELRGGAVRR